MYIEPLEKVLQRDPRRIPCLLGYVRYTFNKQIQQEAVKIALHLEERVPNLVLMLLPPKSAGTLQNP